MPRWGERWQDSLSVSELIFENFLRHIPGAQWDVNPFHIFLHRDGASPKNSHFASIKFPFTIDCWKWCPRIMLLMVTMLSSCAMMATVKKDIRDIQWNLSQSSIFLGIVALVSHPQWQPLNSVNRWATCPHSLLRYPIALLLSSRLFYCLPSQHTLDAYSNATTMASFKS